MAYDAQVATDIEGAFIDLRDTLGGLTGWTVEVDNIGNTLEDGDDLVISTPNNTPDNDNPESIRITWSVSRHQIRLFLGEWDGASFNNRGTGSPQGSITDTSDADPTDSVEYWLQRKAGEGFVFFLRRTMGDGDNSSIWFTYSILNKIWAYDTADFVESHGGIFMSVGSGGGSNHNNWYMFNTTNSWNQPIGLLNPDLNFDNYLVKESLHQADPVQTEAGQRPYIGTQDLFVRERSGNDVQSQDTVLDGADTVYEVLKFEDTERDLLIRAD